MRDEPVMTADSAVHLVVDGRPLRARALAHDTWRFDVPAGVRTIRIDSRSVVPAEIDLSPDVRRLGVHVTRIVLTAPGVLAEIIPSHGALVDGWHGPEGPARWTDGAALLPASLFQWIEVPFELSLHLPQTELRYPGAAFRALLMEADAPSEDLLRACGFEVVPLAGEAVPDAYLADRGAMLDLVVLPSRMEFFPDMSALRRHAPRAVVLRARGEDDVAGREGWPPSLPDVAVPRQTAVPGFEPRRDIALVSGCMADEAAVRAFAAEVMPFARILIPGLRLHVYGAGASLASLAGEAVVIEPAHRPAGPVLDRHRLLVAPQSDGPSGARAVIDALVHGIPAIVSPALAAGLGLTHEREVLAAPDPTSFAMAIARLDGDRVLWRRLSGTGQAWAAEHRPAAEGKRRLAEIFASLGRPDLLGGTAAGEPCRETQSLHGQG